MSIPSFPIRRSVNQTLLIPLSLHALASSRGRTSIHSIHSAMDRRDRQTPSPQMYRSAGENHRPRTPSPSPTNTLTPSYGSRQQSRVSWLGRGGGRDFPFSVRGPRRIDDYSIRFGFVSLFLILLCIYSICESLDANVHYIHLTV